MSCLNENRCIDLSKLPTRIRAGTSIIDWKNSIGLYVDFKYDGIIGKIKIISVEDKKITLQYNGNYSTLKINDFKNCIIGKTIGKGLNSDFLYDIGEIVETRTGNVLILQCEYNNVKERKRGYLYKCEKCGAISYKTEYELKKSGCPCCCSSPRKIVIGINNLATTHPYIASLLKNKQDGNLYSAHSTVKVDFICPNCQKEHREAIYSVTEKGRIPCDCNDKSISYPEKYFKTFLELNKIEFETQKRFVFSGNRRYDFYIELLGKKIIVETHGIQHYKSERQKKIDCEKEKIAIQNGIDKYYQLDCSISSPDYIKHSIISSGIIDTLSLHNTNAIFDECMKQSTKSLTIEICNYFNIISNTDNFRMKTICDYFGIDKSVIRSHLLKGSRIGLCEYDKNTFKASKKCRIDGKEFKSLKELAEYLGVEYHTVYAWNRSRVSVPKQYLDRGLSIGNSKYGCKKACSCDGIEFSSMRSCAEYLGIQKTTLRGWLYGIYKMPQEFMDRGLCLN